MPSAASQRIADAPQTHPDPCHVSTAPLWRARGRFARRGLLAMATGSRSTRKRAVEAAAEEQDQAAVPEETLRGIYDSGIASCIRLNISDHAAEVQNGGAAVYSNAMGSTCFAHCSTKGFSMVGALRNKIECAVARKPCVSGLLLVATYRNIFLPPCSAPHWGR